MLCLIRPVPKVSNQGSKAKEGGLPLFQTIHRKGFELRRSFAIRWFLDSYDLGQWCYHPARWVFLALLSKSEVTNIISSDLWCIGSALKIRLEQRLVEDPSYIPCSLLLGIGVMLVWSGLLRYLGFFHKYNVLILTLKRAFPHVMRFGLCAILLYG